MLRLRTLGEFALYEGEERIHLAAKKQYALLVYLAGHAGRWLRRDRLAALLWGESPGARARHSLSQAVYRLRQHIPTLSIETVGEELILPEAALTADFVDFRAAFEERQFHVAADIYRGDFLPGFWVSNAEEFERWQEGERETLRQQASYIFHRLLRDEEERGNWLEVERLALLLLELDPFVEDVHRAYIHAIAAGGDRARAIRAWRRVEEQFARELGR